MLKIPLNQVRNLIYGRYKLSNWCNCTGYSSSSNNSSCGELEISAQNSSLEQFLSQKRNELVLFQQKASEISTKTFDDLVQQIAQLVQSNQKKDVEIKQLQELCDKNKIEYKPKEKK